MLPPTRVQIKRKATDDPVEILRVHDELARGRNAAQYIFKRQRTVHGSRLNGLTAGDSAGFTAAFENSQRGPQVAASQAGDELRNSSLIGLDSTRSATYPNAEQITVMQNAAGSAPLLNHTGVPDVVRLPRAIAEPRRFHLSRSSMHGARQNNADGANTRRTAGKTTIAVFHERKAVPASTAEPQPENHTYDSQVSSGKATLGSISSQESAKELVKKRSVSLLRLTPVNAVKPRRNSPAPLRGTRLPSGDIIPWNASAERLNMEMQSYTLKEIRKNLAASEEPRVTASPTAKAETPTPNRSATRFKPRPGAGLRYHERHPELMPATTALGSTGDATEAQTMDVDDDDSNYIIETYIRMPVEQAILETNEASIGLLVLDSQPDIDEFYNGDSDSDSDEYDEEEDENAENHPSTDYPDEEVQSDDEYGINPYQYRNRNASDNEEFDEDDARFSDDELETKQPWSRRPWIQAYSGKNQGADADEELY